MRPLATGLLFVLLLIAAACGGTSEPASPVQTFKTYVKAFKNKDITTMKLLLSSETLKMHEQEAKAQGVTVDDVVKRETLLGEGQTTVEYRNEKIDGDRATIEVKNSFGAWETIPFVKENNEWRIDKKGFADQMMQEFDQRERELNDAINQGRQPTTP
ncbi:MAG: hypothetical protein ACK4S4_13180 [Pyrinomonadaceae bacterium]